MTVPEARWFFSIAMSPSEIEALRAGKRVTRTYPERLPNGPPPSLLETLKAHKGASRVTMLTPSMPAPFLGAGDIVSVESSELPREPPEVAPEDLEAVKAGHTVTRTSTDIPPPSEPAPDERTREIAKFEAEHAKLLRVKVVDYRQEGDDHTYTFEVAKV